MLGDIAARRRRANWHVDFAIHSVLEHARPRIRCHVACERLITHVRRSSRLLAIPQPGGRDPAGPALRVIRGLAALSERPPDWIREPEAWRPSGGGLWGEFGSLARHLLATHPVPNCLTHVWLEPRSQQTLRHQAWFRHLGRGHGLRGLDLPLPVSKRLAAWFALAPGGLTVWQALRWAQVRNLGGDRALAHAVATTCLGTAFPRPDYWNAVLRFLISHRCPAEPVPLVIEYLQFRPPSAEFQLPLLRAGQSLALLLHRARDWGLRQRYRYHGPSYTWPGMGLRGFELVENTGSWQATLWRIRELRSSEELAEEGHRSRHCVRLYAQSCRAGRSSIWSLRCTDATGCDRPVLTIQVDPATRRIVQAKGHANSRPTPDARRILQLWADQEQLEIADDV